MAVEGAAVVVTAKSVVEADRIFRSLSDTPHTRRPRAGGETSSNERE